MKKIIFCLLLIAPLLVGCDQKTNVQSPANNNNQTNQHHPDDNHHPDPHH